MFLRVRIAPLALLVLTLFASVSISGAQSLFGRKGDYIQAPKQVSFRVQPGEDNYRYTYTWADSRGEVMAVKFGLHPKDVLKGKGEFRKVGLAGEGNQELLRMLQAEADTLGAKMRTQVQVKIEGGEMAVEVSGPGVDSGATEYIMERLGAKQEEFMEGYLKGKFYVADAKADGVYVRPDYRTLTRRYRPVGDIVGQALVRSLPTERLAEGDNRHRVLAANALEFFQAIPYAREANAGADFDTPIGMLSENVGDCDTKAVALGAVLSSYGIGSLYLVIPGHLFMGIAVPSKPGDDLFVHKGYTYVMAEPAGIGFPLGKGYPESVASLLAKAGAGAPEIVEP
jgi:hypothetical protein